MGKWLIIFLWAIAPTQARALGGAIVSDASVDGAAITPASVDASTATFDVLGAAVTTLGIGGGTTTVKGDITVNATIEASTVTAHVLEVLGPSTFGTQGGGTSTFKGDIGGVAANGGLGVATALTIRGSTITVDSVGGNNILMVGRANADIDEATITWVENDRITTQGSIQSQGRSLIFDSNGGSFSFTDGVTIAASSLTVTGVVGVLARFGPTAPTAYFNNTVGISGTEAAIALAASGKDQWNWAAESDGNLSLYNGPEGARRIVFQNDTGFVGIGTRFPATLAHISSGTLTVDGTSPTINLGDGTNAGNEVIVGSAAISGNLGIGTRGAASYALDVRATGTNDSTLESIAFLRKNSTNGVGLFARSHNTLLEIAVGVNSGTPNVDIAISPSVSGAVTERARLTSGGFFGIGSASPGTKLHMSSGTLTVDGSGAALTVGGAITAKLFAASTSGQVLQFQKSRAATDINTIVQDGDTLGYFDFQGANGTGYDSAAQIVANVDGVPGAVGDMPGRLIFYTTPDGSAAVAERLRIDSKGHTEYSGTAPSIASCGTGATIVGNDNAMKITIGTTPGTCVATFAGAWTNAPICYANNETTANLARATPTTTAVTVNGTLTASDVIALMCVGRR